MGIEFNAEEVLQMAVQIEQNGAKFYRHAASRTDDEKISEILNTLADYEIKHEQMFEKMRQDLPTQQQQSAVFDPDQQTKQYLNALANRRVFDVTADPTQRLSGNETVPRIFRTAVQIEEDSIVFYLGIKDSVSQKHGKDSIEKIIREEMSHISIIMQEASAYQDRSS